MSKAIERTSDELAVKAQDRRAIVKSIHVASITATSHLSTFWIGPPYTGFGLYVLHGLIFGLAFGWLSYFGFKRNPNSRFVFGVAATFPILLWTTYVTFLGIPLTDQMKGARSLSLLLLISSMLWRVFKAEKAKLSA